MANLESLLNDLANLDAEHDLEGMRRIREQIVSEHPESDAAVESLYKLGLDFLFRQREIRAAVESFAEATKRKHPFWSAAARTSLGLCYYHQKRTQKALFELRRVAYPEEPTVHSVVALAFIESIMETEGKTQEVERVRKDRAGQLQWLVDANRAQDAERAERGYYLMQLGIARRDLGQRAEAERAFAEAKELGEAALGVDLYRSICEAAS